MTLPKIKYPILDFEIPSTEQKIKFRPIIVREEKLLLMSKSSESLSDIFSTIKQIVNNCCLEENFDIDSLALYELEYIFLKLRGYSIGNHVELVYKDGEDNKQYAVTVDLEDVKIIKPEHDDDFDKIDISDDVGIRLKYPSAALYSDENFLNTDGENILDELIFHCVDYVYKGKEKYYIDLNDPDEKKELEEFIESAESSKLEKIRDFFNAIPYMEYKTSYVNSNGTEQKIVLRTLNDFFSLR